MEFVSRKMRLCQSVADWISDQDFTLPLQAIPSVRWGFDPPTIPLCTVAPGPRRIERATREAEQVDATVYVAICGPLDGDEQEQKDASLDRYMAYVEELEVAIGGADPALVSPGWVLIEWEGVQIDKAPYDLDMYRSSHFFDVLTLQFQDVT